MHLPTYTALLVAARNATTAADKGTTLENLAAYLFPCLDGVELRDRDIHTDSEELDLVLWNARTEPVLSSWNDVILVECKNWSTPVGSRDVAWFVNKVRDRRLVNGIFVAKHGVTGDFLNGTRAQEGASVMLYNALIRDGIKIIVLTFDDLTALTTEDQLRELIKTRYCKLFVKKVF